MKKPRASRSPNRSRHPGARARTPAPPAHRLLSLIVRALGEKKGEDLRVLSVGRFSSITDYLVIATATSTPHQRALRIEVEKVLDAERVRILGIDTAQDSGWTVIDAFDVMVHIFTADNRDKYRLDSLWKDADELPLNEHSEFTT